MKAITCFVPVLLAVSGMASAAPCAPYIEKMYVGFPGDPVPGDGFSVTGARVAARGAFGFTSFAMASDYSPTQGMSTPTSARRSTFTIAPNSALSLIEGRFVDVFPGRSGDSGDATTLRIHRSGQVQVRLDRWGGGLITLSNLQCYPGQDSNTYMMLGQNRDAYGLNTWTFVFNPVFID